jgi:hypothetical protein
MKIKKTDLFETGACSSFGGNGGYTLISDTRH